MINEEQKALLNDALSRPIYELAVIRRLVHEIDTIGYRDIDSEIVTLSQQRFDRIYNADRDEFAGDVASLYASVKAMKKGAEVLGGAKHEEDNTER